MIAVMYKQLLIKLYCLYNKQFNMFNDVILQWSNSMYLTFNCSFEDNKRRICRVCTVREWTLDTTFHFCWVQQWSSIQSLFAVIYKWWNCLVLKGLKSNSIQHYNLLTHELFRQFTWSSKGDVHYPGTQRYYCSQTSASKETDQSKSDSVTSITASD